ncbi:MAG: DegV family protein [Actinomycetota bacterium]
MIGICTDSNSQFPPELAQRYGVEVVPLTVTVNGVDHLEGVDLDADGFYAFFADGTPSVATAAPSPGRILAAYQRLAARGATQLLSVHIGSAISGTINAALVAAAQSPVPVRVVDTGTASFAIGCAVWEAAQAISAGADIERAAAVAERIGSACGNVFVVGGFTLARGGGRLAGVVVDTPHVPVLSLRDGAVCPIGAATTVDDAVALMAAGVTASARALRVGVGVSDAASFPIGDALASTLADAPSVVDVVRYRVGPSVGAHTGPGTAGAVFYERP